MTNAKRDSSQIKKIIDVFDLKKDKIKNQILQINQAINKKIISINKFQEYADSYSQKCDVLLQNIQFIKNNEAFYQNLLRVLMSEKNDLAKFEKIKGDLLMSYNELIKKTDGLNSLYDEIEKQNRILSEKIEENELYDLAITKLGCKNTWIL